MAGVHPVTTLLSGGVVGALVYFQQKDVWRETIAAQAIKAVMEYVLHKPYPVSYSLPVAGYSRDARRVEAVTRYKSSPFIEYPSLPSGLRKRK